MAGNSSDTLVHYERKSDGTVQSVNEDSPAHQALASSAEWTKTTRAKAEAFKPRRFISTSQRKAAVEQAKAEAAEQAKAEAAAAEQAKA